MKRIIALCLIICLSFSSVDAADWKRVAAFGFFNLMAYACSQNLEELIRNILGANMLALFFVKVCLGKGEVAVDEKGEERAENDCRIQKGQLSAPRDKDECPGVAAKKRAEQIGEVFVYTSGGLMILVGGCVLAHCSWILCR
jgi:hypothetical protein